MSWQQDAAEQVGAFAKAWRETSSRPVLSFPGIDPKLTSTGLDVVLQERQEALDALATARARVAELEAERESLKVEWSPRASEGYFGSKQVALDAAAERYGTATEDDIAWRRVGNWRNADEFDGEHT